MPVPAEILALVAKFREHLDDYKSGRYNETQVRREFVDPFFKALGWDVDNTASYAEGYKDVVHEDAIKIGGSTKAPDYSFRIGGVRKFFVETKKPSVNVKGDPVPAYQLRRYAWSAKLPLSIVTDFEELAVYDCRTRPQQNDKASKDRTLYLTFDQYEQRWDEIAGIFSREAILRGSFDKYAASKKKRGTAEVDDEFLKEIERWREVLAKNLALRNKKLSQRELNFAVQRTIDRIIFLRICEDRGIEPIDQLRGTTNGRAIYKRLGELFRAADAKYNSGLFHFERERGRADDPDELSLSLAIDDKVLVDIIRHLYYPDSPYEFSVLPADILGQVYERFLGKVIRLTASHQAKIEEKPEVRKAGGVYYTPTYIVDYIVENTVGKLLEDKTPQEISGRTKNFKPAKGKRPLSVLDPACGSGSFLIGAYQHLLDWHLKWYSNNNPETYCKGEDPRIYQTTSSASLDPQSSPLTSNYRLTTAEKKRILLDHIYGVDIDPQAVEVTKLSLLLKVLEGETRETLQRQLFAKERALPDLAGNIKCGNSLIGPDFYNDPQAKLLDDEEQYRINVFDWQAEFREIFSKNAGFHAVIGNPPYRRERDSKDLIADLRRSSYGKLYYQGKMDFWYFFLHRAMDVTRNDGRIGFIVPSYWLKSTGASMLRERVRAKCIFVDVVDFGGNKVFSDVSGKHMVFTLVPGSVEEDREGRYLMMNKRGLSSTQIRSLLQRNETEGANETTFNPSIVFNDQSILDFDRQRFASLFSRMESVSFALEDTRGVFRVSQGVVEAPDVVSASVAKKARREDLLGEGVFVINEKEADKLRSTPEERELIKPYLRLIDVERYSYHHDSTYLIYSGNADSKRIAANKDRFPAIVSHLDRLSDVITSSNAPYGIHRTRDASFFNSPKLLCPNMFAEPSFAYCDEEMYVNFGFNVVVGGTDGCSLHYLLGILNSKLGAFWFNIHGKKRGVNVDVGVGVMRRFPIRDVLNPSRNNIVLTKKLVECVRAQIGHQIRLRIARTAHEQTLIQRQITATDAEIDRLVYELYGLSDDEIRLIEEATTR